MEPNGTANRGAVLLSGRGPGAVALDHIRDRVGRQDQFPVSEADTGSASATESVAVAHDAVPATLLRSRTRRRLPAVPRFSLVNCVRSLAILEGVDDVHAG
jgi:hypothetical protein